MLQRSFQDKKIGKQHSASVGNLTGSPLVLEKIALQSNFHRFRRELHERPPMKVLT